MDKKYLDSLFKEPLEKMVRNYIFSLDELLDDSDSSKMCFDKKYDFVKLHECLQLKEYIKVKYQIVDSVGKVKFFKEPVYITIPYLYLFAANYHHLKKMANN